MRYRNYKFPKSSFESRASSTYRPNFFTSSFKTKRTSATIESCLASLLYQKNPEVLTRVKRVKKAFNHIKHLEKINSIKTKK